jgi:hypothetical protein
MTRSKEIIDNNILLFLCLWALLFLLYLPAINAGFVSDFTGWLDNVKNTGFREYINREHFHQKSLYQFTQFSTYIFYQLFGAHAWLWHILHITLQAINSLLLFRICYTLLKDSQVKDAIFIAAGGTLLYSICPHISEVVVWEPSYHYLQGLLFILLPLFWLQRFLHTGQTKYAWWSAIIFLLSTHSLEIFYITPWLLLAMIVYYRVGLGQDKKSIRRALLFFFLPVCILFVAYLLEYWLIYHQWVAHIGSATIQQPLLTLIGKPAKYLYNIIFFGRFFPAHITASVYAFCDSNLGLLLFYGITLSVFIFLILRFKKMNGKGKVAVLFLVWLMCSMSILLPLWFQDMFLVLCDRYTYFIDPFIYMLLALLISYVPQRKLRLVVFALYALVNLRFNIKVNRYWMRSASIIHNLLHTFPDGGDKTTLLLDLPQNMNGVPMITATPEGEFKLMLRLFAPEKNSNKNIYDVAAFNMISATDGVHVNVINDSTLRVTENQWGTWWWYNNLGCPSYENSEYKLNTTDGHFYDLVLKKPSGQYLLLYQSGGVWRTVDMNKKNEDQY